MVLWLHSVFCVTFFISVLFPYKFFTPDQAKHVGYGLDKTVKRSFFHSLAFMFRGNYPLACLEERNKNSASTAILRNARRRGGTVRFVCFPNHRTSQSTTPYRPSKGGDISQVLLSSRFSLAVVTRKMSQAGLGLNFSFGEVTVLPAISTPLASTGQPPHQYVETMKAALEGEIKTLPYESHVSVLGVPAATILPVSLATRFPRMHPQGNVFLRRPKTIIIITLPFPPPKGKHFFQQTLFFSQLHLRA